jgi:sugar phosphate isomerase/epimerase
MARLESRRRARQAAIPPRVGAGSIRWEAVFRAIAALSVKPRLILELRHHRDVAKGAAYLKALGLVE